MNMTTYDPRPFTRHMLLAAAWVRYNSRSGKASEKQTLKVMDRQSADVLYRMLAERNALPQGCEAVTEKPLTADQRDGGARYEAQQNADLDY